MCGIYVTNKFFSKKQVKDKIEKIKFRGPDYTGIISIDNLIFGHLRLAILDLDTRSNQPMQYNNHTVVFNGEIYNFIEVKEELINNGVTFDTYSDTEVILKGFIFWGTDVIYKLNGMFSFVIYDRNSKQLFCFRDRLGVKPFYFSWQNGMFESIK